MTATPSHSFAAGRPCRVDARFQELIDLSLICWTSTDVILQQVQSAAEENWWIAGGPGSLSGGRIE
jgi:hypothetical protein